MSILKSLVATAAPVSLLMLGACAAPFNANVTRFQQLPVPQGQTFVIQSSTPMRQDGLEFASYAGIVAQRLTQQGYRPVERRGDAQLVVSLDYGVDTGREKIVSRPDPFYGFGYGGFGYGGFGYGGFGRFGGYRGFGYSPFYYGWGGDPFFGGYGGTQIDSYTVYTSFLEMKISRASDGQRVFEGRARARSANDNLTELVPNLVTAMFTNFPGRSGEEVRITIPPAKKG